MSASQNVLPPYITYVSPLTEAYLLFSTVATDHAVGSLHWMVLTWVMANVTGICLATAGEPVWVCVEWSSYKCWPVEAKRKTRRSSVRGHKSFVTRESGKSKLYSVLMLNCTSISGCLYHQVTSFAVVAINIISLSITATKVGTL